LLLLVVQDHFGQGLHCKEACTKELSSDGRWGRRYRSAIRNWAPEGASVHDVRAQGLVEYALIISIVAVMAIAGLILFGPAVDAILSTVTGSV
jgi:hypothetical protein